MKLLHLEDDAFDIELTRISCVTAAPSCRIISVSGRQAYLDALEQGGFDGIISDSGVLNLSGLEALKLAREKVPGVPFLFLCGSMSPDARSELSAAGPDGIVSKDDHAAVLAEFRRLFKF